MQMNWRLLTAINAAIALITISAVIFGVSRTRPQRSRNVRRQNATAQPNSTDAKFDDKEARNRVEALTDLSNARVDDLGAVPASELTHLMDRATPEQLAALAFKFNDAPTDARTFGGMGVFFQAWTQLDPRAALNGAFQLKDVTMRKLAAIAVVNSTSPSAAPIARSWVDSNWPEASRWIQTLTGSASDNAAPAAMHREDITPQEALSFGVAIKNDATRTYEVEEVIRHWSSKEPQAAEIWVKGSSLPAEDKERLLKMISDIQAPPTESPSEEVTPDQ